jgi:cellulose synthase/poly-beta-1,6-N-acetylglucosamine synthase-like glycosyltransferase
MAVYDTEENERTTLTRSTLASLEREVTWNWGRHRLMVSDNGSCEATQRVFEEYDHIIERVYHNDKNLGTAAALNKLWRHREPGEVVCKIDNDVVVYTHDWPDRIELALEREPRMGICALKRKDLGEWPLWHHSFYRSELEPLWHEPGEPWMVIEKVNYCMGTCQAFRPELLDKIGYLWQPGVYGFDDSLAAVRCDVAGFFSAFLLGIDIDHIDPGDNQYTEWKRQQAGASEASLKKITYGED